ncbi:hypothetical protein [Kaistia terrae]|uniref:Helix-turn-helix domain-containing protein n=1 Tax=Kaistia terrae TaxID=537017 RepID=A0ABW0PVB4_9HYPH|nr:hypothetical protein [Kaistia terrae]MCX5579445.1 hypothetical protein [Kaistia terrae]
MTKQRIDFLSVDAARFNALRDQWRDVASGCVLPVVAHKLASLLPAYVSREYGYAFPTDEQLAETIKATPRTVGRGMNALDTADLIERKTVVKRDDKGEAIGRLRRIFLTLPHQAGERTTSERTEVNGQAEVTDKIRQVNGQQLSEYTLTGLPLIIRMALEQESMELCPHARDVPSATPTISTSSTRSTGAWWT